MSIENYFLFKDFTVSLLLKRRVGQLKVFINENRKVEENNQKRASLRVMCVYSRGRWVWTKCGVKQTAILKKGRR